MRAGNRFYLAYRSSYTKYRGCELGQDDRQTQPKNFF
jgi:hypothetical protein